MKHEILREKKSEIYEGKCDKGVVLVEHDGVKYTVVFHNIVEKSEQKLMVYWNGSKSKDWGQSIAIEHKVVGNQWFPFEFNESIEHQVAEYALKCLGSDTF